jgi:hypothetical protein
MSRGLPESSISSLARPRPRVVAGTSLVVVSSLMWVTMAAGVRADAGGSEAAAASGGPWGLGGAYLFGFLLAFVFLGVGLALNIRKNHLTENGK